MEDSHHHDGAGARSGAGAAYPTAPYGDLYSFSRELPEPDVYVVTSGGLRIPAHSGILASWSPVLENMIERPRRKHRSSEKMKSIPIPGVPSEAVTAFIEFFYFKSRRSEEQMEKYGVHLLALSHVYMVPHLKQRCTKGLGQRLSIENVVDVLQLARLCDAPDLYLKCMKLVYANHKAVEATEAWKFLQDHDPWLELEILQFIDEAESRKKQTRRYREEQNLYLQLSEAMECLEHICTEGCTKVGPHDMEPKQNKGPCSNFSTCEGLQLLIQHFGSCKKRVNNGGCSRCKRMWQLLRLHSSICDKTEDCKVPLCRQFKMRSLHEKRKDEIRWKLLVKKVVSAKVISSLSQPKRKRMEEVREMIGSSEIRSFRS